MIQAQALLKNKETQKINNWLFSFCSSLYRIQYLLNGFELTG